MKTPSHNSALSHSKPAYAHSSGKRKRASEKQIHFFRRRLFWKICISAFAAITACLSVLCYSAASSYNAKFTKALSNNFEHDSEVYQAYLVHNKALSEETYKVLIFSSLENNARKRNLDSIIGATMTQCNYHFMNQALISLRPILGSLRYDSVFYDAYTDTLENITYQISISANINDINRRYQSALYEIGSHYRNYVGYLLSKYHMSPQWELGFKSLVRSYS